MSNAPIVFQVGSHVFTWGWPQTIILPTYQPPHSWITGSYHHTVLMDWDGLELTFFCWGWLRTMILLTITSWVAGFQAWAWLLSFSLFPNSRRTGPRQGWACPHGKLENLSSELDTAWKWAWGRECCQPCPALSLGDHPPLPFHRGLGGPEVPDSLALHLQAY
jgi:hypothetical protein